MFFSGLLILLTLFSLGFSKIHAGVKSACIQAKQKHDGDCVESLIAFIKSETSTLREKNRAIWALGQLADKKALPFLEEMNESIPPKTPCNHDEQICQYEIEKAIKWCRQGNLTSWMYKNRENWQQ